MQDANAALMWKEALEHLTTGRRLDQLCSLILEEPAWTAIHDVVRAVQNAEGSVEEAEPQEQVPPRRRIALYALAAIGGLSVLVIGVVLLRPASTFPLTVYVHGPSGVDDLPLRNKGEVLLDLGGDRRRVPIGDQGQAILAAFVVSGDVKRENDPHKAPHKWEFQGPSETPNNSANRECSTYGRHSTRRRRESRVTNLYSSRKRVSPPASTSSLLSCRC